MDLRDSVMLFARCVLARRRRALGTSKPSLARQPDNGSGRALFPLLTSFCVGLCACWGAPAGASDSAAPIPLDTAIKSAAEYLHGALDADGRFSYVVDGRTGRTGRTEDAGYNLLRHAGALYALAAYHAEHPAVAADRLRLQRAVDFMFRCCIRPHEADAEALVLWSPAELVGGRRDYDVAKLGGAGLAVIALLSLQSQLEGAEAARIATGLGRFILSMQMPSGGFYSLFAPELGGRDARWTSLYYPGEAALALVLLYRHDRNVRWLESAADALRFLARQREVAEDMPPDHWALIATAALLSLPAEAIDEIAPAGLPADALRAVLLEHAARIVRSMLADQRQVSEQAHRCAAGGFVPDARTTPTATRLEGLLAIRPLLPDPVLRDEVGGAIDAGIAFLRDSQLVEGGLLAGAFPRTSPRCGSSVARADEVRIDYVQHALAAMLRYRGRAKP